MKGIIFDYGGTLDTRGNHWARVLWAAYQRHEIPVDEKQFREAYVFAERTLGRNPIVRTSYTFKKLLDVKLRLEMEYLFTKGWWMADKDTYTKVQLALLNDLYEGVCQTTRESREVLQRLGARFPMVLVSNFYGNIGAVLQEFQLDGLFRHIVESAVVGVRKPDPHIFGLGVEALGLSAKDVLVVGDSIDKDIIPAHRLGCRTVWLKGLGWTDDEPDAQAADHVITNLAQLADVVECLGGDGRD